MPTPNEILLKNLQPFLFVLKEGNDIKKNPLNYSLLMLQTTNTEFIPSPDQTAYPTLPGKNLIN